MLYKFRGEEVNEDLEPETLSVDAYMKRKWGDSLRGRDRKAADGGQGPAQVWVVF